MQFFFTYISNCTPRFEFWIDALVKRVKQDQERYLSQPGAYLIANCFLTWLINLFSSQCFEYPFNTRNARATDVRFREEWQHCAALNTRILDYCAVYLNRASPILMYMLENDLKHDKVPTLMVNKKF
jgi:hypothetical protein